jgi:hypothetical protein
VDPRAAPSIAVAVTSPSKTLSEPTWPVAFAVAEEPDVVAAEALIAPVVTTDPSAGYAKADPKAAWSGGEEITPAAEPAWPGTRTRIAKARAEAPALERAPPAPTVPRTRTASPASATTLVSRFPTVPALSANAATV